MYEYNVHNARTFWILLSATPHRMVRKSQKSEARETAKKHLNYSKGIKKGQGKYVQTLFSAYGLKMRGCPEQDQARRVTGLRSAGRQIVTYLLWSYIKWNKGRKKF